MLLYMYRNLKAEYIILFFSAGIKNNLSNISLHVKNNLSDKSLLVKNNLSDKS